MTRLCAAILLLNIVCCTESSLMGVPAWGMFRRVDPLSYSLRDRRGRALDVRDHVAASQYIVSARQLSKIVGFICRKEPERAPFLFEEKNSGLKLEVKAPECRVAFPD